MNTAARLPQSKTILIVEDARSDRARFRLLLERHRRTDFEFAWHWPTTQRASVHDWFMVAAGLEKSGPAAPNRSFRRLLAELQRSGSAEGLRARLLSYELILLDLAWSGTAEDVMRSNQHLTESEGKTLVSTLGEGNCSIATDAHPLFEVEGIALLEWLANRPVDGGLPDIWVTSAYVPETALGLRAFLRTRYAESLHIEILHKWLDETVVYDRLGVVRRG